MNPIYKFFKRLSVTKKVMTISIALLMIGYIFCLPRQLFHVPYSTVVTDRNEELLGARIASDGQWRFPPRKTTPEKIKQCLITFEDKHFYHHWGVNPLSTGRALYQNLKNKRVVSGGSTLTMQTIRLARNKPRTIGEKVIEMIWATRLEFRTSKEEILSMYVSHAPFGGNVVGLDAAAWRYFGHSAEDLSWAESAMLAVLPNAPAMIHLSKGRKTLLSKRNRLLKQLFEEEIIDASTYELAISEPLPDEPHPLPQIAPHLVTRFYQERNGLYTRSTIDKGIQTHIESLAERWSNEFNRSDIRNLAILIIDIPTNQVVAYCGNVHFDRKQGGNQVDVIQAPRSTGSILKPFLYGAMLQEGSLLPQMLLPDVPVNINGFTPQNFSMQFEGARPRFRSSCPLIEYPGCHHVTKIWSTQISSHAATNGVQDYQPISLPLWIITHFRRCRSYFMGCDECLCTNGTKPLQQSFQRPSPRKGSADTTGNRRKDSFGKRWFKKSYFRKDHFKKNNFEKGYIRRSYFRRSHFCRSGLAHPFRLNRSQPP